MERPWEAERDVDRELARALVAEQFPELADLEPRPFGAGWDNTAWRFGEWVFRFPRRAFAVPFLEKETRVLPAIAGRLPLAIPAPSHVGRPTAAFPWPFAGYRCIEGRTACVARLDEDERDRAALDLAAFLRALHDLDPEEARALGAGGDTIGRLAVERRRQQALERLTRLEEHGRDVDAPALRAILDELEDDFEPRATTLVHGDFYVRHWIVGDDRRVTGVIDWGDVHVGDPALDLSAFATWVPPRVRPACEAIYGEIDDRTRRAMRFRGAFHSLALLWFAHEIEDADLAREARRSLAQLCADR